MQVMLCRNRVKDFPKWKKIFDSHAKAHREAGLFLLDFWRDIEEPNNLFFLFEVKDIAKARVFINNPEAAAAGKAAGVMDGEYHFLEKSMGY